MNGLREKIIAAIEKNCSEGASGRIIGVDDAADDILEAIEEEARLERENLFEGEE